SRGELSWLIAFPADGGLILEGLCPYLIQWSSGAHPASRLPDRGISLLSLEAIHPEPEHITRLCHGLKLDVQLAITRGDSPRLVPHFITPSGMRHLSSVPEPSSLE